MCCSPKFQAVINTLVVGIAFALFLLLFLFPVVLVNFENPLLASDKNSSFKIEGNKTINGTKIYVQTYGVLNWYNQTAKREKNKTTILIKSFSDILKKRKAYPRVKQMPDQKGFCKKQPTLFLNIKCDKFYQTMLAAFILILATVILLGFAILTSFSEICITYATRISFFLLLFTLISTSLSAILIKLFSGQAAIEKDITKRFYIFMFWQYGWILGGCSLAMQIIAVLICIAIVRINNSQKDNSQ